MTTSRGCAMRAVFSGLGSFDNRPLSAPGYHDAPKQPAVDPEHHPCNRRATVSSVQHWNGTWMACGSGPLVGVLLRLVMEHEREAA